MLAATCCRCRSSSTDQHSADLAVHAAPWPYSTTHGSVSVQACMRSGLGCDAMLLRGLGVTARGRRKAGRPALSRLVRHARRHAAVADAVRSSGSASGRNSAAASTRCDCSVCMYLHSQQLPHTVHQHPCEPSRQICVHNNPKPTAAKAPASKPGGGGGDGGGGGGGALVLRAVEGRRAAIAYDRVQRVRDRAEQRSIGIGGGGARS